MTPEMKIKKLILPALYYSYKYSGYLKIKNNIEYKESGYPAHIITFHRVTDEIEDDNKTLTVKMKTFDKIMRLFKESYNVISLSQLVKEIEEKKGFKDKTAIITFDDGYKDNYIYAAPILIKYNLPACFFVTTGFINTERSFPWDNKFGFRIPNMSWDDVNELVGMGYEIGAHTVNHVNLGKVDEKTAGEEILNSKKQIEDKTGKPVLHFSYPFGGKENITENAKNIIRDFFKSCSSCFGGKVFINSNVYNLYRIAPYPTLFELQMELDNFMTYFDGKMRINF